MDFFYSWYFVITLLIVIFIVFIKNHNQHKINIEYSTIKSNKHTFVSRKPIKINKEYTGHTAESLGLEIHSGYSSSYKKNSNYNNEINVVDGNNKDAWEGWFYDNGYGNEVFLSLKIGYTDANNVKTIREILTKRFNDGYILAHCLLRKENRNFSIDRISNCLDTITGEIVNDIDRYLKDNYEKTVNHSLNTLSEYHSDTLKVLYYVAKADGQFRKQEKEIVACYLGDLADDKRIKTDHLKNIFDYIDIPTVHGFKLALNKALKNPCVNNDKLRKCCIDIVNTQKSVTTSEADTIQYIDKKLSV